MADLSACLLSTFTKNWISKKERECPSPLFANWLIVCHTIEAYPKIIFAFFVSGIFRYALLGAASFLGGSMRMTVSLCVIMVEISNNLKFLPLIMLVLLISKVWSLMFTCRIQRHSICERKSLFTFFHFYDFLDFNRTVCRLLVMLLMKDCMKSRLD